MASKIIVDQLEKSGYTTLTLPSANATANQYIKNDGAGALSWATLPSSGKVLQVIQVNKDDEWTVTGTTMTDITGMAATITPTVATSKILVMITVNAGGSNTATHFNLRTFRDAVQIAMGAASGSRSRYTATTAQSTHNTTTVSMNWLDEPATTSATVYKLQASANNAGHPIYINRTTTNTDNTSYAITVSSITLMEIGV
jgi:hypothetical protein